VALQSLFYLYPLILHEESPGATNTKEHFYPPKSNISLENEVGIYKRSRSRCEGQEEGPREILDFGG
jgi:hypothetical protein